MKWKIGLTSLNKTNGPNMKSSKDLNTRTLQEIHDDMLKTGFPNKKSKFISK